MWKKYFKIKGIKPGVIIYPRPFGRIDFASDNLDINILKAIIEDDRDLPYLEMTEAGIDHFYDDTPDDENQTDINGNDEPSHTEPVEVLNAKEIVKLIKNAESIISVSKYSLYTEKFSSVKKAYNKRIEELYQGS